MALQYHKLDLGTVDCERFLVSVDVPKDHQANETIRALLDEHNEAWNSYSRNRVRHSVLLTASEREESFRYACEWLVVPTSFGGCRTGAPMLLGQRRCLRCTT